jgi:hypothetical protein
MKDNKTDERNQEQTGSTSNQPTTQDVKQKETSTNTPVDSKEEKSYPSVVVEDEDDTITNGSNKITDVPNKDQNNSKEIVNDEAQEEKITNTPSADDTGTNTRKEGVTL